MCIPVKSVGLGRIQLLTSYLVFDNIGLALHMNHQDRRTVYWTRHHMNEPLYTLQFDPSIVCLEMMYNRSRRVL